MVQDTRFTLPFDSSSANYRLFQNDRRMVVSTMLCTQHRIKDTEIVFLFFFFSFLPALFHIVLVSHTNLDGWSIVG